MLRCSFIAMRRRIIDIALVGICIGIAVVLIRSLTSSGSSEQWWALALAGLMLACIQSFVLRRTQQPTNSISTQPLRPVTHRTREQRLFANELDGRWTGLADTVQEIPTAPESGTQTSAGGTNHPTSDTSLTNPPTP
jgi:hypothetical protein